MKAKQSDCSPISWVNLVFAFSLAFVLTPGAALGSSGQEAGSPANAIQKLIDQLGDPSFIRRQEAKKELEKIGLLAFESLRIAQSHPDIEIAKNAEYLLQSMRVVWALPNDSFSVQQQLKDYNDRQPTQREESMQRLAQLNRADAVAALLRLARFEGNEHLSKCAALHVMELAVDKKFPERAPELAMLVESNVKQSHRVSTQWLQLLANQLKDRSSATEQWRRFAIQEHRLVESNSRDSSESVVKRLFRWTAKWLVEQGNRDEALAFIEPSLDLLGHGPDSLLVDLAWMLDEHLPEAVIRFATQRPELFTTRARERYLLADAHARLGKENDAKRIASEAQDLIRSARGITKGDDEARQRLDVSEFLSDRGRYDWELGELLRAQGLGDKLSSRTQLDVCDRLSQFHWEADDPEKAAQVLLPIIQRAGLLPDIDAGGPPGSRPAVDKDLVREMEEQYINGPPYIAVMPGNYFYYRGLASMQKGELPQAQKDFKRAIKLYADNPDFLIGLYQATRHDAVLKQETEQAIESLEQEFRSALAREEANLAAAISRRERLDTEFRIASNCNQLAWLLSKTERKPSEAVALSRHSLNLRQDEPTFLDTLGRCYFSAGHLDKAIQVQSQALALAPYERQLKRQLEEFQAAKDAASNRR